MISAARFPYLSPGERLVTGCGYPPSAGIRESSLEFDSAAMMFPSSPQLAPRAISASHRTAGVPPWTEIFFSLLSAKNAIHCASGEKKGWSTSSVPVSNVTLVSSRRRVASKSRPPSAAGVKHQSRSVWRNRGNDQRIRRACGSKIDVKPHQAVVDRCRPEQDQRQRECDGHRAG